MIAEYVTRRDAEIYARELTQIYGPDVHFDVVGMPDPVFADTVWYVLGTGTIDGEMFAQYAQEGKHWHKAAAVMEKPILPSNKGDLQWTFGARRGRRHNPRCGRDES